MSIYGKKIIANKTERRIESRKETRDMVVWDYDLDQRICRGKVQGSDEYVIARFPSNWNVVPSWMKPGNAVRITHKGGERGLIEIVGDGQVVPTPLSGSGTPSIPAGPNTVISGMNVTAESTPMQLYIGPGSFRINNRVYTFTGGYVTINASPPVGMARYDLIVVGVDGQLHVVQGTPSTSPTKPSIPANHALIKSVLVVGGVTTITNEDIDAVYTTPDFSYITMTIADDDLAWNQLSTTVTVYVKDQYGNNIASDDSEGWDIELKIINGNGTVSSADDGTGTDVHQHLHASSYYAFTYTRPHDGTDCSPVLMAILDTLQVTGSITLRDANGDIMLGIIVSGEDGIITGCRVIDVPSNVEI